MIVGVEPGLNTAVTLGLGLHRETLYTDLFAKHYMPQFISLSKETSDSQTKNVMTKCTKIDSSQIPGTSHAWYLWLSREEAKTVAAYHDKPALLIADYHRERAIARDYEGREILELLQNANDQAAEVDQIGRVRIELSAEGLIVANTGLPFSVEGVASLQTSHLSPKRRGRKQLIGNKGLGFRSILNWTSIPIILSDALCIAYCLEHAKSKLKALTDEDQELARLVNDEVQGGDALILPLLLFPLYSEDGNLVGKLDDAQAKKLFERSEELLLDDFTSVIGMPFDTLGKHDLAEVQIKEIRPEILLFARHLGELCFDGDLSPVTWRRKDSPEHAEVLADGKPLGQWIVYRTVDKLPEDAIESDNADATNYEIVVAVPIQNPDPTGVLYCHFPTDINLPLPIVCHASLELEQNRKHLQQGRKCNSYILGKLAEFIAETAEKAAAKAVDNPWAGCALLMPRADYPSELKREGFPGKLIEFAKDRNIVPTLGGKLVTASNAFRIPGASVSWLPKRLFSEVAHVRNATDDNFLCALGAPALTVEAIKSRIVNSKDLTPDERVSLIGGLLDQTSLREAYTSALFLDSSDRPLADGMRVFLSPASGVTPEFPDWADFRFLSDSMRATLALRLGTRDSRDLQQKLAVFGLMEYSLANVVGALVAEANRAAKGSPEKRVVFHGDLLSTVFELYTSEELGGKRPAYPERSPLNLPNQSNGETLANTLYFGRGFGASGEITQAMYGHWAPEKLVSIERLSAITTDRERLQTFLLWIGVAQWPRIVKTSSADKGYLQHVLSSIKFPAQFEDKVVAAATNAISVSVEDVQSIDGLDEILSKSEPAAISAWLANDDRAAGWGRQGSAYAKLKAYPDGVHNPRFYRGALPSYIRWRIETTPWLRSIEGISLKPKDCVLGERAIEELFPRPVMPEQEILERYEIQQRDLLEGWQRSGVLTSLAYLERDEIYAKLLELPHRSPDGKLARPLYHWLLDASDTALGGSELNQRLFLKSGKMWGRHGQYEGYFPIGELHHSDAEGLPEALLQKLKIVALRKRVGADKVERLFGVRPVDRAGIGRKVVARDIAPGSGEANADFQSAKPYLHKLRTSQTSQLTQLYALKDLQLEVCSTLRVEITFEEIPLTYDVPIWEWLIEGKTVSVRSDPARPLSFAAPLLADAVGQALASIFRIADGGDFARMLSCEEGDRLMLLQRLRGESVLEDIETIRTEYDIFTPRLTNEAQFPISEPPKVQPPSVKDVGTIGGEAANIALLPLDAMDGSVTPVQILELAHTQAPAIVQRKLQVKTVTTEGGGSVEGHLVTDGDFCERKAMEFEESSAPPRWPLLLGQVMGADGPGCDVLSFASRESRDAFQSGPTHDLNTVERFIEVKGRGSSGASIELKGNELSAAERYGNNYYLYRFFEIDNDTLELSVLKNPLIHKEALMPAVHVVMQRTKSMQVFSISGGLKKNSHVDAD